MQTGERVVFNTAILYIKVIVSLLISLISVPMVLNALGASDYGVYNLVAGVIAMLAFLNLSMNVATQRYISVAIGANDNERINTLFNSALVLHLIIGLIIVIFFEIGALFVFDDFLNIEPDRIWAAKIVYQTLIVSTLFTILSVPDGAVINAKENMLALSIIHIVKDVLMLLLALFLSYCPVDRLVFYGFGVALISIITVIMQRLYVYIKYKEFKFQPFKYYGKDEFKSMLGFTGWNTFGAVATISRNQGIAIIFNLFYGTIINAAYGVANQIQGVLSAMVSTFTQSINPQLMQSKGMKNEDRLVRISMISSKYSFAMYSLFAIPLIIEMPKVLKVWLGTPPEYTLGFSQLVIILSMVQIYSNGLMSAIQATGKIAAYQVAISMLILLNIPICYSLLRVGLSPYYCLVCFIVVEVMCLLLRMLFAQKLASINLIEFSKKVIIPTMICVLISIVVPLIIHFTFSETILRVFVVSITYALVYVVSAWFIIITAQERETFLNIAKRMNLLK